MVILEPLPARSTQHYQVNCTCIVSMHIRYKGHVARGFGRRSVRCTIGRNCSGSTVRSYWFERQSVL